MGRKPAPKIFLGRGEWCECLVSSHVKKDWVSVSLCKATGSGRSISGNHTYAADRVVAVTPEWPKLSPRRAVTKKALGMSACIPVQSPTSERIQIMPTRQQGGGRCRLQDPLRGDHLRRGPPILEGPVEI